MIVAKGKIKPCWMLRVEEWGGSNEHGSWSGNQNNPNPKSHCPSFTTSLGEGIHMKFWGRSFCINEITFGPVMTEQGETKENYSSLL